MTETKATAPTEAPRPPTAMPRTGRSRSTGCRAPASSAPRTTPSRASGCPARSRGSASSGRSRSRSGSKASTRLPRRSSRRGRRTSPSSGRRGSGSTRRCRASSPARSALLEIQPMPGAPVRLSTGVIVLYADDESFTFMTPEGHTLSAWITFSARSRWRCGRRRRRRRSSGRPTRSTRSPTCSAATARTTSSGRRRCATSRIMVGVPEPVVDVQVACIDGNRQWRYWRNVRNSATIRSARRTVTAPIRWITRRG